MKHWNPRRLIKQGTSIRQAGFCFVYIIVPVQAQKGLPIHDCRDLCSNLVVQEAVSVRMRRGLQFERSCSESVPGVTRIPFRKAQVKVPGSEIGHQLNSAGITSMARQVECQKPFIVLTLFGPL